MFFEHRKRLNLTLEDPKLKQRALQMVVEFYSQAGENKLPDNNSMMRAKFQQRASLYDKGFQSWLVEWYQSAANNAVSATAAAGMGTPVREPAPRSAPAPVAKSQAGSSGQAGGRRPGGWGSS